MKSLTIKEIRKAVLDNTNNWDDFDHLGIKEFRTHAMHIMVLASSMTLEKNKGIECKECEKRKKQHKEGAKKTNATYTTEKRKEAWKKRKAK